MKSLCRSLFSVILVVSAVATQAAAVEPIGSIVALQGYATATGTDGAERRLQIKSPIYLNDKLTTGRSAKVQVVFDDDSVISQGENSEMVIDKYVYSPKEKKDASCSMKFASGVFRVVTGKITSINPDRFKVQTRMATIGIRGCEVGFALDGDREDVYILWLPSGKSILVEKAGGETSDSAAPDLSGVRNTLNVVESGIAVSITEGAPLLERAITPLEMVTFYQRLAIDMSQPSSAESAGKKAAANAPDTREVAGNVRAISGEGIPRTLVDPSGSGDTIITTGGENEPPLTTSLRPSLNSRPSANDTPTTGPTGGGPTTTPGSTTPTDPLPPSIETSGGGPMDTWSYVVYGDGSVEHSYAPGYQLSDADFQILKQQGSYQLTGQGAAAAYITHPGGNKVVTGTCNMNVQMGSSPTWSGAFAMQNGTGDNLSFDATGSITTGAQLQLGSVNNYQLLVNGSPYDGTSLSTKRFDLTSLADMRSALTGIGGSTPSVKGLHGHFVFIHGTSPMVNGVFGTNLQ